MIKNQKKIEIGDVCCLIGFENGFFEKEFSAVLSDYRRWGFCSEGMPQIRISVKRDLVPAPSKASNHIFYHLMDYDSVRASLFFDTKTFEGRIGISTKRDDQFSLVRILELTETFIYNAYLFYFLLNDIGTFIHSCGIADRGNGYIFAGPSGEGKSTIARLSHSRTILCDELILLRKSENGKRRIFGTPFFGDSASINEGADCKAIYFIQKSSTNELVPISRMAGTVELMKEGVIGSFMSMDWIRRIYPQSRFLNLLLGLLDGVPCFKMRFKKDNSFWEAINA